MPVAHYHASLFQDRKNLHHFLLQCQQTSFENQRPQIASISVEVQAIDPLVILQELTGSQQPHFYLEKGVTGDAIAAIGTALAFETDGITRFSDAQHFVQSYRDQFSLASTGTLPAIAPRFFCSFTFFDQVSRSASPFPATTVFLPQWQVMRQADHSYVTANFIIHSESDVVALTETIWKQFQTMQNATYGVFNLPDAIRRNLNRWDVINTDQFGVHFGATVISALQSIRTHTLSKIVLAHALDVSSRLPFQWIQSLHNLRQLHPDCCVFSTSSGGQSFIGASPERLLYIRDRHLITDALAGSAPRGDTARRDNALAQQLLHNKKERHEHQVVVDFIARQLISLGLTPHLATIPELLQLSNIQHLHTPIHAALPAALHPLNILAKLHPTPAVAGMPRDIACEHIRRYERFERSLYAAPLGWVDTQGNAEFIVGIRSALIDGHHARLYAGAGIVAGSDPKRELAEIKLKFQALLRALV